MKGNKRALGFKHSNESRKKMTVAQTGNKKGLGHRKTEEYKKYWSEMRRGEKGTNWQGGITPENELVRHSVPYREWRKNVYERDEYTCQSCKNKGGRLIVHHIENFASAVGKRLDVDNGITFCTTCHNCFHKRYGKKNNSHYQIKEFLNTL